jgi:ATP-dependent Lon protease
MTESLRLVPLDDTVVFPNMNVTLAVDVGADEQILLMPRHGTEFATVGVIADVTDRVTLPGGASAVTLFATARGIAGPAQTDAHGVLRVQVDPHEDTPNETARTRELERDYRAVVEAILELRGADERISAFVRSISSPGALDDTAGYAPELSFEQKVELLETLDIEQRLARALELQREHLAELQVRKRIRDDVDSSVQKQQREFVLRQQLDSIKRELDDDSGSIVDEYRAKIDEASMPEEVEDQAMRELDRLERSGDASPEGSMTRSYLDWLLAVPWANRSADELDVANARAILDEDHAGLEEVKDSVVEYPAVRGLRADRGIEDDGRSGAILTLVGPPGTGKTSIGESIARSLGREFVRMSLGGVRDEAEIRGHRRTYIGALPGRLVRALRDAKTMNPVIMLDEVDKVGADWRGDPSSALLEVLAPAQNHSFRDHYLDVEVDLSEVFFIATANVAENIPGPLLDRMEVIRFDGYTVDEKVAIARSYLWPRQLKRNGLRSDEAEVDDETLETIVREYTREAGVRQLERQIGSVLRRVATTIAGAESDGRVNVDLDVVPEALGRQKFFSEAAERTATPGVATGLAVTSTGGDELGIADDAFAERSFHLHVPAGAISKDGPSAGITMVTALASLLTRRPVKHTVGMTGEVTLRGRVIPSGGLKQKVLAAHAAGITEVILPERNRPDLEDVPEAVRDQMTFHPVMTIDEVLELALEPTATDVALSTV